MEPRNLKDQTKKGTELRSTPYSAQPVDLTPFTYITTEPHSQPEGFNHMLQDDGIPTYATGESRRRRSRRAVGGKEGGKGGSPLLKWKTISETKARAPECLTFSATTLYGRSK